jgi:hypothetical protein
MCDYSLAHYPNRLAVEGEQLVVHRFSSGTLGLASPRQNLKDLLLGWGTPAVCVPPGRDFGCTTFLNTFRRACVSVQSKK